MYVQNGDRPRWAWSGQHVEVAAGWELSAAPPEAVNGAASGPPAVELVGEAAGRPSWAWGGERGMAAAVPEAAPAAAPVAVPAATSAPDDRPAWSWGGTVA